MHRRQLTIVMLFACLATACAGRSAPDAPIRGGTQLMIMPPTADGYARSYRLRVPESHRPGTSAPLVVVAHGAFSDSATMEMHTGFSALAEREGFIVAYPDGIGLLGLLQHWNAGHCCGKAAQDEIDDVGFIAAMIEQIGGMVEVDTRRVYMVGFSNGAMLTHRIAAEKPELLAAIAPLSGAIDSTPGGGAKRWQMPAPRASMPVIMFHGLDDQRIPYSGEVAGADTSGYGFSAVEAAAQFWSSGNRCITHGRSPYASTPVVTVDTWSGCQDEATVQLYSMAGWGHRWPGRFFTDRMTPQSALQGFDAAEIIWSFFQQHERRTPSS